MFIVKRGSCDSKMSVTLLLARIRKDEQILSMKLTICGRSQIELLLVLVELAEVENLIHQVEQSGGVAVDEFQLAALAVIRLLTYHRLQRREDEGERGAELMAHISEEI